MKNVLDTLDPVKIGQHIAHFREVRNLSLIEVAYALSCDSGHVDRLEMGITRPKASEIVKLAMLFDCQMFELLHGPYPPATDDELLASLARGDISESQAAYRMHLSPVEVRMRLERYQQELS